MVARETAGHGPFEQLAAGYALDALEPADEQRFLRHASHCTGCARTLASYREVAAALAGAASPAEPRPELACRIVAAALTGLGTSQPAAAAAPPPRQDTAAGQQDPPGKDTHAVAPSAVVPLRPRPRRWLRWPATAAAAVLIAGAGTWAGLAVTGTSSTSPRPAAAGCAHESGCAEVTLTDVATRRPAAKVLVQRRVAWMVPFGMKADDTAGQIYVLWQITARHRPMAVGSFDVRAGAHAPIRIGALAAPYAGTLAFAVSLEHGRTIPAAPSDITALGPAS